MRERLPGRGGAHQFEGDGQLRAGLRDPGGPVRSLDGADRGDRGAAVARGAAYLEKHFTLDRSLPGPDHQASLLPAELRALVVAVREVESALGDGVKRPVPSELPVRDVARKSLVAARDLAAGAVLGREDLDVLRPGTGLSPAALPAVLGRRTSRAIPHHTPITEEMLSS
jgi:N,N'-diacetyllegionaminate synthase